MTQKPRYTVTVPPSACGMRLSSFLSENGYPINAACGGVGKCGKCLVKVESGQFSDSPDGTTPLLPNAHGELRACRAYCTKEEAVVSFANSALPTEFGIKKHGYQKAKEQDIHYAVALDIGTTTLAAALVSLPSGTVLATHSAQNPCTAFGADIISRIAAARNGDLAAMQNALLSAVQAILAHFHGMLSAASHIDVLACVGNTTMLHLFWGVSPEGMAAYPFTPAFTHSKTAHGCALFLDVDTVISLPCATAFFGADAVAGILETALCASATPALLLDLGTNGELALYTGGADGKLYVTSTAAGPAFEGAGISTGVGGIVGAVSRVTPRGQRDFSIQTIGGATPVGICGSALIDLVSSLRLQGRLDETGYLCEGQVVYAQNGDTSLSVTQEDIRAFQVAKSAIRAGIDALLDAAGLSVSNLDAVYLGGGMGHYLHEREAKTVGLLPNVCAHVSSVQNSALGGAVTFLKNGCDPIPYRKIAARCIHIDLGLSETFSNAFMAHMRLDRS